MPLTGTRTERRLSTIPNEIHHTLIFFNLPLTKITQKQRIFVAKHDKSELSCLCPINATFSDNLSKTHSFIPGIKSPHRSVNPAAFDARGGHSSRQNVHESSFTGSGGAQNADYVTRVDTT